MVTHTDTTAVLGGETASLLDAPRAAPAEGDPFSRAFETGRGGGGYTIIEERTGGGPEGESRSHAGEGAFVNMVSRLHRGQPEHTLTAKHGAATSSSGRDVKALRGRSSS